MRIAAVALAGMASAPASAQSFEQQLLELVNLARWDNGQLPPLKGDALLDGAAEAHSEAMASRDFFAHCDPDTRLSPFQRMRNAGYVFSSAGENLAAGGASPAAVLAMWMGSLGHREHILSTNHREIGTGYAFDPNDQAVRRDTNGDCDIDTVSNWSLVHYWAQDFGRRADVFPLVIVREAYRTADCEVALYLYGEGSDNQMRLSNDGSTWSAWGPLLANSTWTLAGAAGSIATVHAELRIFGLETAAADSIRLDAACGGDAGQLPLFSSDFE